MGEGNRFVTSATRESTKQFLLQYANMLKSPYNWQMGKLLGNGTATLADGSTITIDVKGRPGEYAPVFNFGDGTGLVDIQEPSTFQVTSGGGGGMVLARSGTVLNLRRLGSDNKVYSFDLSQFGFTTLEFSNAVSELTAFSPNGEHICVAIHLEDTPSIPEFQTIYPCGYIDDFDSPYYYKARPDVSGSGYSQKTPRLRFIILKNIGLVTTSLGQPVILPESIQTSTLDILTPYLASLQSVPEHSLNSFQASWNIAMTSTDTVDTMGEAYSPLGIFYKDMNALTNITYERLPNLESKINYVALNGITRIQGNWSFTEDFYGEPLLEFLAYADNVRYRYALFYPVNFDSTVTTSVPCKIARNDGLLDGCPPFRGNATRIEREIGTWSNIGNNITGNPWIFGNQSRMAVSDYFGSIAKTFTETINNSSVSWSGTLTRDTMGGFCAPTYVVTDCFDSLTTADLVLVADPDFPGTSYAPGVLSWPLGLNFPLPFGIPDSVIQVPSNTLPPYNRLPYGPFNAGFDRLMYANEESAILSMGYSETMSNLQGVYGAYNPLPPSCYGAFARSCPNDPCSGQTYPQSAFRTSGNNQIFLRNAIRSGSLIQINNSNTFSVLNSQTIVETQTMGSLTQTLSFNSGILPASTGADVIFKAERSGIAGSYTLNGFYPIKSLSYNLSDNFFTAGGILKVYKSSGNINSAYIEVENTMIETRLFQSRGDQPTTCINNSQPYPKNMQGGTIAAYSPQAITSTPPAHWVAKVGVKISDDPIIVTSTTTVNDISNLNLTFSTVPVFTSEVFFSSIPSWLSGSSAFRALDPDTFCKVRTVSGRREITKYRFSELTGPTQIKFVRDGNSVSLPGVVKDVWIS